MAELKVTFDKDQMQEIVDKAVNNVKADIINNILEQIHKDITDLCTGEESDDYMEAIQDCVNMIDRWEKKIREMENI